MTRWSVLDLTGQLLKQYVEGGDGETWEIVQSPAILLSGESLFPQWYPRNQADPRRHATGGPITERIR